jgi:hypothetical protein
MSNLESFPADHEKHLMEMVKLIVEICLEKMVKIMSFITYEKRLILLINGPIMVLITGYLTGSTLITILRG